MNWAFALITFVLAGCSHLDWIDWQTARIAKTDKNNPAVKIVCIWEPAEGNTAEGLPTRGMAGQILFFTQTNPSPAIVDGDVRIYLFDDKGASGDQAKPVHQFDFLGDAWKTHAHKSTLGPTYNVFIPYGRKPNQLATCGLQVRLTPKEGPTVFSEMVYVTLPGKMPAEKATAPGAQSAQIRPEVNEFHAESQSLGATLTRQQSKLAASADAITGKQKEELPATAEQLLQRLLAEAQVTTDAKEQTSKQATASTQNRRFRLAPATNHSADAPVDR